MDVLVPIRKPTITPRDKRGNNKNKENIKKREKWFRSSVDSLNEWKKSWIWFSHHRTTSDCEQFNWGEINLSKDGSKNLSQEQKDIKRELCLDFLVLENPHFFFFFLRCHLPVTSLGCSSTARATSTRAHISVLNDTFQPLQSKKEQKFKCMLIWFFGSQEIVYKGFVAQGQTVNRTLLARVSWKFSKKGCVWDQTSRTAGRCMTTTRLVTAVATQPLKTFSCNQQLRAIQHCYKD